MPIYRCDVKLCATAYIKADSGAEARKILESFEDTDLQLSDRPQEVGGTEKHPLFISGQSFDNPALPGCSLSPAMTFAGAANKGYADLEERTTNERD